MDDYRLERGRYEGGNKIHLHSNMDDYRLRPPAPPGAPLPHLHSNMDDYRRRQHALTLVQHGIYIPIWTIIDTRDSTANPAMT